jgi:hypothetical protein
VCIFQTNLTSKQEASKQPWFPRCGILEGTADWSSGFKWGANDHLTDHGRMIMHGRMSRYETFWSTHYSTIMSGHATKFVARPVLSSKIRILKYEKFNFQG